ncbi:hypothetical protein LUZ62_046344 [Rhynchospora pubera]|uniref:Zinc-ribbon domain-containing protein n=1 Tax=Rhynchospora pubera TaxID=906938 RepID=A0AAV8FW70_9POAL|nr:hypothetical protein LUZ62_046344 [Rhynchospora pubera]
MASNSGKIRFVRCPKCLQLLIEYSTVPLYQCGGCGTVLKAKNKNVNGETPDLNLEGTRNPLNSSPENVSPDSLSIFSTEPNNTPSSSDAQLSEPSEDEFKATPLANNSSTEKIFDPNAHASEQSEDELKESSRTKNSAVEKIFDPPKNPTEGTPNGEEEKDEMQNTQSVLSEEDAMSRCSNAYDGSISSSDEGKRKIHDRSYYLQKSRRTFRKKAPAGVKPKEREGLPPRPPNEKFSMRYGTEVYEGVSLDSSDFQILRSLIENDVTQTSLPEKYNNLDRPERLRKMDELREQLNKFSKQKAGESLYHHKGIDSIQRLQYQNSMNQESPLCFDSRHKNDPLKLPYPYLPAPLPPSHCSCMHCTNGLYRTNSCNQFCVPSSFPGTPSSIDQESIKSSSKDKRPLMRKHICRPIFGGTPYVICDNCFKLLQVPTIILISKKRLVELQCGNCSEVLAVPLPSNKFSEKRVSTNLHGNVVQGNPLSLNENYGASFSRSYSIGGESEFGGEDGDREAAISSLHRLMGYNSATELLYSRADAGYDSFESMVPHSYTRSKNT